MKLCLIAPLIIFLVTAQAQENKNNWDARLIANEGTNVYFNDGGQLLDFDIFGGNVEENSLGAEILYQTTGGKIQIGLSAVSTVIEQHDVELLNFEGGGNSRHQLLFKHTVVALMPVINYNYIIKKNFKLYSETSVGIAFSNYKSYETREKYAMTHAAFQFSPLGFRLGKKIGGFAELGYGYKGILQLGVSGIF